MVYTRPTVLVIGLNGISQRSAMLDVYTASTAGEAAATIRLVSCDLLVVGLENRRMDVWGLIHRVQTVWPQQRWLLASSRITAEEEVQARSMGALMVLSQIPSEDWLAELAASLRRRDVLQHSKVWPAVPSGQLANGVPLHSETI